MTQAMRTSEANLLFEKAFDVDTADLDADVTRVAERLGLPVSEAETDLPGFRLFDLERVQLLIAGCAEPLDVAHFVDAARPGGSMLPDSAVLARLTAHRFSLTVLATASGTAGDDGLQDALCWRLTEALRARFLAPLVFWCASDTLYAGEEFAQAGTGDVAAAPETGVHRLNRQQMLAAKAMTYMQTQIGEGAHKAPLRSKSRQLSRVLKAMAAEPLEIARQYSQRVLHGSRPT